MRAMLYPAPRVPVPSPPPEPWKEVRLQVEGTGEVVGWAFESRSRTRPIALFLHGNGENLETVRQSGLLDRLRGLGLDFLALDYPGYGISQGRPSETSLVASGVAAVEWLRARYPSRQLLVCGWSLGAGVAMQVAARLPGEVDGLVLMSPWSSLESVGAAHYPRWLVRMSLSDSYDSLAAARGLRVPALVVHGDLDQIIPTDQGRELARVLDGAEWVPVAEAGHNDLLGRPAVWNALDGFISRLESSASGS